MSEQEEFEFRHRLEQEQAAPAAAPAEEGWGHYLGRQALGTLPVGGMVAGGMMGAPEGGVGAIPGAAVGYAAGKNLERLGKQYLLGDEDDKVPEGLADQGRQAVGDLTTGATAEMGGQVAGKALGAIAQKAKLSDVGKYISDKLGRGAEDLATSHLQPTAAMRRNMGPDGVRSAAREALDSGAVGFGSKVDTTAANLSDLKDAAGATMGDIVNASDAKVDPLAVAKKFEDEVISPLRGTAENEQLVQQLTAKKQAFLDKYAPGASTSRAPGLPTTITRKSQFIPKEPTVDFPAGSGETTPAPNNIGLIKPGYNDPAPFYSTPDTSPPYETDPSTGLPIKQMVERRIEGTAPISPMSPAQVEAEKRAVQGGINYNTDPNSSVAAKQGWASTLRQTAEDAIQDPAFKASKRAFGNLSNAEQMAERAASSSTGGLTDVGVNTTALAHPNPITVGAAGARALTKGRMSSAGAVALDKSSQAMQTLMSSKIFSEPQLSKIAASPYFQMLKNAGDAGGAQAVTTTHYVLQQTDPGYQQLLKDEQN